MKTLIRILIVQLSCLPLLITDAMARDGGGRGDSKDNNRSSASRPSVHSDKKSDRNPITQSKASRPNPKPADRPSQKPDQRPSSKPNAPDRPQTRPAPDRPNRPESKPADRPNKPDTKPGERPNRPETKPGERPNKPDTKPGERPNRPETMPGERPNKPDTKPGDRPNRPGPEDRPNKPDRPGDKPSTKPNLPNRPETKPGNVNYPKPDKPMTLPGNVDRPGNNKPGNNRPGETKPGNNRPNHKPEVRPGKNTKPIRKPQFDNNEINVGNKNTNINNKNVNVSNKNVNVSNKNVNVSNKNVNVSNKNTNNNWWNSNKNVNNNYKNNHYGNNNFNSGNNYTQVNINNNFKNNVNWSTNHKNWGYNPWWNRPATRPWYGGSWNCGWNNNYYHHNNHYYHGAYYGGYRPPGYVVYEDHHHSDVAEAIGWGLVGWSLGKLIFDSGYQTYSNPYPAQPVPSAKGSQVTYTQPITVVAAQTAPEDQDASKMTEQSESFITESQDAFKQADYLRALEAANKAIAEAPGDGALHEYRALVLFALGKYSEAAGVLNPVLAGGPGWDWTTMVKLYNSQETYMSQLESLEKYSSAKPDAADAHFLLGYHYMVCGHLDRATVEFETASKLQPADSVSAQLRDLTKASSNNGDQDKSDDGTETPAEAPPAPDPVPLEKLTGTWVSDKGAQGTVTLAFKDDGKFIWTFNNAGKSNEFGGEYSMNDNGLLVLDAEESQMVASVELPQDSQLKFVLAGGPPGDPGLVFAKK